MERSEGVVLGLACGDALGRPVEFRSSQQVTAEHGTLTEMVGHGTWGQPAGTITDDTDQALCIARSLDECGGFDPADIADRFVAWYDSGPFDIGNMTRQSIRALKQGQAWDEAGQQVWETSAEGSNAGNGSVMRCPPLAVALRDDPDQLAAVSRESSLITHADPRCTYGCAVLNLTVAGFLRGESDPLASVLDDIGNEAPDELVSALTPVADGNEPASLSTSGYVVDSLQTALHDALSADSAEDAIVTAVNRGGDADTIGAIAGAVAGARFGAQDLPERWLSAIDERYELTRLAHRLAELEVE
jgi:ADP-ribosyl-[dinitrogen reductase] hydrolase